MTPLTSLAGNEINLFASTSIRENVPTDLIYVFLLSRWQADHRIVSDLINALPAFKMGQRSLPKVTDVVF